MDGHTMEQIRELLLNRWKRFDQLPVRDVPAEEMLPQAELIDMAQSLEQLGRDTSLKEQGRRELKAVELALEKLSSGGYGCCEDCGEEIPSRRLMVLPEARLCAHCQTFEERQNARTRISGSISSR